MRTIRGQIMASTSLDLHAEKLTEEQLRHLFDGTPSESVLNQNHDLSQGVVGRMYNKQLVRLESGELAIAVDIDILDEDAYAAAGGFSISYKRGHYSVNSNRKAEIEILFNPRVFSIEEFKPLLQLSTDEVQVDAIELVQKGFEATAILILQFVGVGIALGFFRAIGSDAYNAIKSWLKRFAERRKRENNQDTVFQIQFTTNLNGGDCLVLIQFSTDNFPAVDAGGVSFESAFEHLTSLVGNSRIQRATITIINTPPYWKIASFVNATGETIRL
jgi:hypothetical protein